VVEGGGGLVYVAKVGHLVLAALVLELWNVLHVLFKWNLSVLRVKVTLHNIWFERRLTPLF